MTDSAPTLSKLEMAHVLFMDVVGYSLLPMDQQESVLRLLQEVVSARPQFLRATASGELLTLPTGDGMALVFFGDPQAAAQCALEVDGALKSHPTILLRMEFLQCQTRASPPGSSPPIWMETPER